MMQIIFLELVALFTLFEKKNTFIYNYIKNRISKQLTFYEILLNYFIEEIKR